MEFVALFLELARKSGNINDRSVEPIHACRTFDIGAVSEVMRIFEITIEGEGNIELLSLLFSIYATGNLPVNSSIYTNVWDNCPRVEVIWLEWAWLEVRHALSWMATNQTAFHYRWSQVTSTLGKVLIHSMLSHFPLTLTHWDWWRLFRVFLMHLCNCMFVVGKLFGLMWFRNSSTRCFVKTIQFQHSNELGLVESASCIMSRQLEFEWEPL